VLAELYVALIHAPVYNKNGQVITTSITNLDLHDIARACATYGVQRYYVVHPAASQRSLAKRIMNFWQEGYGSVYNPDRQEAFARVELTSGLEEVIAAITATTGSRPMTVATDARLYPNTISYQEMRKKLEQASGAYLLLFGTGWGLLKEDMAKANYILAPLYGPSDYNHLSVRSAVSIILDRLRGK
jgi:hypothetical protein